MPEAYREDNSEAIEAVEASAEDNVVIPRGPKSVDGDGPVFFIDLTDDTNNASNNVVGDNITNGGRIVRPKRRNRPLKRRYMIFISNFSRKDVMIFRSLKLFHYICFPHILFIQGIIAVIQII